MVSLCALMMGSDMDQRPVNQLIDDTEYDRMGLQELSIAYNTLRCKEQQKYFEHANKAGTLFEHFTVSPLVSI